MPMRMYAQIAMTAPNEPNAQKAIADAVNARGFTLRGADGLKTIPGRMTTQLSADEKFDWMILATQPPQIEEAATRALPHLAGDGRMVCLQNGLCEERIAKIAAKQGAALRARPEMKRHLAE